MNLTDYSMISLHSGMAKKKVLSPTAHAKSLHMLWSRKTQCTQALAIQSHFQQNKWSKSCEDIIQAIISVWCFVLFFYQVTKSLVTEDRVPQLSGSIQSKTPKENLQKSNKNNHNSMFINLNIYLYKRIRVKI